MGVRLFVCARMRLCGPPLWQLTIYVNFPKGTRARDVVCDYTSSHIKFGLKGKAPLLDKPLTHRVQTSECSWLIGEGRCSACLPDCLCVGCHSNE